MMVPGMYSGSAGRNRLFTHGVFAGSVIGRAAILLVFLLVGGGQAAAHPNVFITYRALFDVRGTTVIRVGESWLLDPAFSAKLLTQYDTNHDGILDKAELATMDAKMAKNLSGVRFFSYLSYHDSDLGSLPASDFHAVRVKGRIILAFWLTLPMQVDVSKWPLRLQVKDPDFYISASLAKQQPISFRGIAESRCNITVATSKTDKLIGWLVDPQMVSLSCQ